MDYEDSFTADDNYEIIDDIIEEEPEEEQEEDKEEKDDNENEDEDDDDVLIEEDTYTIKEVNIFQNRLETPKNVYNKVSLTNNTIPILTKYEKANIIGERAMQIAMGAPTLIDVGSIKDPREIAIKELKQGKLPFLIRRPMPGKKPIFEIKRVKDLY